jgi:hypothetical protein
MPVIPDSFLATYSSGPICHSEGILFACGHKELWPTNTFALIGRGVFDRAPKLPGAHCPAQKLSRKAPGAGLRACDVT